MADFKSKTWYGKWIEGALILTAMLAIVWGISLITNKVAMLKAILDFGFLGFTIGKSVAITLGILLVAKLYKPKNM